MASISSAVALYEFLPHICTILHMKLFGVTAFKFQPAGTSHIGSFALPIYERLIRGLAFAFVRVHISTHMSAGGDARKGPEIARRFACSAGEHGSGERQRVDAARRPSAHLCTKLLVHVFHPPLNDHIHLAFEREELRAVDDDFCRLAHDALELHLQREVCDVESVCHMFGVSSKVAIEELLCGCGHDCPSLCQAGLELVRQTRLADAVHAFDAATHILPH